MLKGKNIAITQQGNDTLFVLYSTTIVRFNDQKVTLNTGGYRTATTKRWMNKAAEEYNLLYQVESKSGKWIVRTPEQLPEGSYDIRSNKGGIAVSGEVTLHEEKLYVEVSKPCTGSGHEIMYRSCKGRKDYTGGHNHYLPVNRLVANCSGVVNSLKTVMEEDV